MKLHKLSNGNWIDLTKVTAIVKHERTQCYPGGSIFPDRVVIHMERESEVLPCDDLPQAQEIVDELAALVNRHNAPDQRPERENL